MIRAAPVAQPDQSYGHCKCDDLCRLRYHPSNAGHEVRKVETVYLDTETTGLDPGHDELVEIPIVNDGGSTLVDTLIHPQRCKQWTSAQRIHGIAPEDVREAPTLDDVLPEVVAAVTGARLVIYNASFDMSILPDAVGRTAAQVDCCMEAFAAAYGELSEEHGDYRWQSLATAAFYVDHSWQGPTHRAYTDALACRAVWHYLTGSTAYRAEVEARRQAAVRITEANLEAAVLLSRHERRIQSQQDQRCLAAHSHAERLVMRFFLRQTAGRHWLSCLPPNEVRAQLAAVFLGLPDKLPSECYAPGVEIQTIYHRKRDIPDHLAYKSWFPTEVWIHGLLTPVAAFVGPRFTRALYDKDQFDEIKSEYRLRLAPLPERPCTRTMLRQEGDSKADIDAMTPAAERYNKRHHFWYRLYDRDALC